MKTYLPLIQWEGLSIQTDDETEARAVSESVQADTTFHMQGVCQVKGKQIGWSRDETDVARLFMLTDVPLPLTA